MRYNTNIKKVSFADLYVILKPNVIQTQVVLHKEV